MFIIIEGLDKCGKTTLCNYLLKNIPKSLLLKIGDRPKDSSKEEREKIIDYYHKILLSYKTVFKNYNLILDRFLISEFVYSGKRGYDATKNKDLISIKKELESISDDVCLIYCRTEEKEIVKKFIEDKEEYAKIQEVSKMLIKYDEEVSKLIVRTVPYNYMISSPEKVYKLLKDKILK